MKKKGGTSDSLRFLIRPLLDVFRIEAEEIEVENATDVEQHARVDSHLVVYLVDVGAVTAQFAGEPDRRLAFFFKFLANATAYMYHYSSPESVFINDVQRYKKNMHNNRLHVVKNTTCSAINYIIGCFCGFKQPPTPIT